MLTVTTPPRLSVVVPTYNRAPLLRRTLTSLAEQRDPPLFEVIVADDGSADDSEQVAAEFRDRLAVRYCHQEDDGYRVARARNLGAAIASAPVLVFLDSGTLAGPDLLAGHLRHHAGYHADPGSSAHGPAVIGYAYGYRPYDPTPGLAEAFARLSSREVYESYRADPLFRDSRHEALAAVGFDLSGLKMPWLFFWTLNVSLHAADYAAVGGFDERFCSWGGEDLELGYRLHQRGVPFVCDTWPWAMEIPHERDCEARTASDKSNALRILMQHPEPAAELFWALMTRDYVMFPAENGYRELLDWTDQVSGLDVQPEVDRGTAGLPAGARVAVFGSGASVPGRGLHGTLVDFDARLLAKAPVEGRFDTRHGIGLRTALPDHAFDRVVITSRLSRLWSRWGEAIRAEAARIGTPGSACSAAGLGAFGPPAP